MHEITRTQIRRLWVDANILGLVDLGSKERLGCSSPLMSAGSALGRFLACALRVERRQSTSCSLRPLGQIGHIIFDRSKSQLLWQVRWKHGQMPLSRRKPGSALSSARRIASSRLPYWVARLDFVHALERPDIGGIADDLENLEASCKVNLYSVGFTRRTSRSFGISKAIALSFAQTYTLPRPSADTAPSHFPCHSNLLANSCAAAP